MMLFHAKAPAGGWVGGGEAWDRTQLLAVEWGAANVQSSDIEKKKKKYKGEIVQHLYPLVRVCAEDKAPPATAHARRALEAGGLQK